MNPKTILEIPGEPCDDSNCANDSPGAQKRLLSAMLCIAGAVSAPAQSQVPEEYYFDDLPIVLSVTRLKQSLADTPASMTIIDKDMIRASGAMNIPDLLRHVPGFQVAFVTGKRASVTAHGRGTSMHATCRSRLTAVPSMILHSAAYPGRISGSTSMTSSESRWSGEPTPEATDRTPSPESSISLLNIRPNNRVCC